MHDINGTEKKKKNEQLFGNASSDLEPFGTITKPLHLFSSTVAYIYIMIPRCQAEQTLFAQCR